MQQELDQQHSIPTLEQATAYINAMDFTLIINKMHYHEGWNRKQAITLSEMYRRFLFLAKKYGEHEKLPPSVEMDEFWHNHILDTAQYRKDCLAIFGQYLDHYAYFGIDDKTNYDDLYKAFRHIEELYTMEFPGEIIHQVRGPVSKIFAVFRVVAKNLKRKLRKVLS